MKRNLPTVLGAAALLSTTAITPATAGSGDSTAALKAEVAELTQRLDALERGDGGGARLSFGAWPGTDITIYGYVRGDFIQDLDGNLGTTTGGIATLGAPGGTTLSGDNFQAHAKQSRLGIRSSTGTEMGDLKFTLEGDFFGAGNTTFRLRHAYGALGGLTAGQTWTNFMPLHSLHATVDFNGTAGVAFARQTQARYTFDAGNGLSVSGSIEDALSASNDPVVTAAVKYTSDQFTLSGHALGGRINTTGPDDDIWGGVLAGSLRLWQGGNLQLTYGQGDGISSYMTSAGGLDTVGANAVGVEAYTAGITQALAPKWSVGAFYGQVRHDNAPGMVATSNRKVETVHANLFYKPVENVSIGLEYFTGERTDFGGAKFQADRVQTMVQFNF